jgi:hypothetical protein
MTKEKLNEEFLIALSRAEQALTEIGFTRDKYIEKGYAQFVYFKSKSAKVEFLFGPSDWHVDMIIYVSNKQYSFGDLLKIPAVLEWVNNNRYKEENGRHLQKEILWFIELLRISHPIICG